MSSASICGGEIRYEIDGDGPPLVLVHELGGSLASFDALVPRLAPSHRILRYDQNGCGTSSPLRAQATLDEQAEILNHLVTLVFGQEPCMIVGLAAGAAIAVTQALARADRVSALALCSPAIAVAPERRGYLEERAGRARRDGMAAIAEASLARSYPPALRREGGAFERYRTQFLATDPESYAFANLALAEARLAERLPELTQPCLLLAGRHDLLRPQSEVEALARQIPEASFGEVASGHIMPVQSPDEMAEHLLAFFDAIPMPTPARGRHHA
ncbi:alpha/beta fold hydrolase [Bosea thiooxidans]